MHARPETWQDATTALATVLSGILYSSCTEQAALSPNSGARAVFHACVFSCCNGCLIEVGSPGAHLSFGTPAHPALLPVHVQLQLSQPPPHLRCCLLTHPRTLLTLRSHKLPAHTSNHSATSSKLYSTGKHPHDYTQAHNLSAFLSQCQELQDAPLGD